MPDNTIYDFDTLIPRDRTNSVKWEFAPGGDLPGDAVLPLWIADMDFPCAQPIVDAMKARVDRQIFGYSSPQTDDYLDAVTGWFQRRANWQIDAQSIRVAPGIVPALGILIRMLTSEGDGIIIQNPVYYPFTRLINAHRRTLLNNALIEDQCDYRIDFDDLKNKAAASDTKLMILCNPHNPVGRLWTEQELTRIAEICLANDVVLISDDIHCDLVRNREAYTPVSRLVNDRRIITCTSASKSFNLAGLHVSNIIIDDDAMREAWQREAVDRCGLFGANALGIVATQAAYNHGEGWLNQVNDYITANLEYVAEEVAVRFPKARCRVAEGTYFSWIDFRDYGYSAAQLERAMLGSGRVALDEGHIFGVEGRGFERINAACPRSVLLDCLERMERALSALGEGRR